MDWAFCPLLVALPDSSSPSCGHMAAQLENIFPGISCKDTWPRDKVLPDMGNFHTIYENPFTGLVFPFSFTGYKQRGQGQTRKICVEDGRAAIHAHPPRPTGQWLQTEINLYFACTVPFWGSLLWAYFTPTITQTNSSLYSMGSVHRNGWCPGKCQSGKICYLKINI